MDMNDVKSYLMIGFDRYLVATTTIWSGASYVYSKDAVKILTKEEQDTKVKSETDPKPRQ